MKSINPAITSGFNETYWIDSAPRIDCEIINGEKSSDVVIVGAGISGLSVAYTLVKAGLKVIVLEDGLVGSGETGRTTAHLVNALDDRYTEIEKTFGEKTAKLAAESHTAAVDYIETIVKEESIDCDFKRMPGYLFLDPTDEIKTLQDEFEATRKAGINSTLLPEVPAIRNIKGPCIKFPDQAQFHPMLYIVGLCNAIKNKGGEIFQYSHVSEVKKEEVVVNGFTVRAKHIVIATNSPINNLFTMHTKQHPYRTYVVAAEIPKGSVEQALWWDTGDQLSKWVAKPYHYVRTQSFNATTDLLIIGGEDHKTGQAESENVPEEGRYALLEKWAKAHFPMITNIAYRWSGQVMEPIDMLGFIGKNPGDDNVYIVTGDSGNGMTHGAIAGILIPDLILRINNPWSKIYDPSRITFAAASDFAKEASNMASHYLEFLTPGDIESTHNLIAGEGAIIRSGVKKIAVYRDEKQTLHSFSALCPHLGCYVHWNNDEKSFDCPCHGSRFTCEGKVVNGPAVSDLKALQVKSEFEHKQEIVNKIK